MVNPSFNLSPQNKSSSYSNSYSNSSHFYVSPDSPPSPILPPLRKTQGRNDLSTLMGVYIPCMLSILGAILFLRLSWAVGQAGFFGVVGIFLIAGSAVLLTTLSVGAISTNGTMGGGGAYFMISRSIGPEFGGAVGIIFYFANTFSTTFYLVAFAENIVETFFPETDVWTKIAIASIALFFIFLASWIGAGFFSKLNVFILVCIAVSAGTSMGTLIWGSSTCEARIPGFTGPSATTLANNLWPEYGPVIDDTTGEVVSGQVNTFFRVFRIVFPAMTGFMAGANLSGDLRDPGRSIGKGTIRAIVSCLGIYLTLSFIAAWTLQRSYLQIESQALVQVMCWPGGKALVVLGIVCSTLSSGLGALTGASRVLQAVMTDFVHLSSSKSSSSSSRRFQQLFQLFARGSLDKNEPRPAIVLTYLIAQSLMFLGSLDRLAGVITNCFLLTHFFTNVACFLLHTLDAPNFRPRFRCFSWHTALLGAALDLVIMYLASPVFASASIGLLVIMCVWIYVAVAPSAPTWGSDVSQALMFHVGRKTLLRLDAEKVGHAKFWRPNVLLLPSSESQPMNDSVVDERFETLNRRLTLIQFCHDLVHGGLYLVGDMVNGTLEETGRTCLHVQEEWTSVLNTLSIEGFVEVAVGATFREGATALMVSSGLGGLTSNTVVLPFYDNSVTQEVASTKATAIQSHLKTLDRLHTRMSKPKEEDVKANAHLVGTLRDALVLRKNILVMRNFEQLHMSSDGTQNQKTEIEIWLTEELDEVIDVEEHTGSFALMLNLAHGLSQATGKASAIRVVYLISSRDDDNAYVQEQYSQMQQVLRDTRMDAEIKVLCRKKKQESEAQESIEEINQLMRDHVDHHHTKVMFINLPPLDHDPPSHENSRTLKDQRYLQTIERLCEGLPPSVLTIAGQGGPLIATAI